LTETLQRADTEISAFRSLGSPSVCFHNFILAPSAHRSSDRNIYLFI